MKHEPHTKTSKWADGLLRISVVVLLTFGSFAPLLPGEAPGLAEETFLIVNSDMSVRKYAAAQLAFKETVSKPTKEIDLGAKEEAKARLERMIKAVDPKVIYCIGSKAYLMAHELAKDKKIVLSSAINWQRFPLGPKTYGIANELPTGLQLTMFRYFFPDVNKIGVLYSKKFNNEWLKQAKAEGKGVSIEIVSQAVKRPRDISSGLRELLPKVDALWLIPDPVVLSDEKSIQEIFAHSDAMRKPILAYDAAYAERGAVMAISADVPTIGRQAAGLAEEIFAEKATGEEFQTPAGSEITINLKIVLKYGLKLNEDALDSVNRIVK